LVARHPCPTARSSRRPGLRGRRPPRCGDHLRAFFAVCVFLAVALGLVQFLRDGNFFTALVVWIGGALAAGMLATPRVRAPERRGERPRGTAPTA
jgi:hypothetical protein